MKQYYIKDLVDKIGQTLELYGWVDRVRDHKKVVFVDVRDRTGTVQVVGDEKLSSLGPEDVVYIKGLVKERPAKLVNPNILTGKIEIEMQEFKILSKAEVLPFDYTKNIIELNLPTLLDWRTITLRHPQIRSIFEIQQSIADGFRLAAKKHGCVEIFTPTISASATEGGAEVFEFDYFDYKAFLIQSPQLYKQMMVPIFERVSLLSHAYRAEPSYTTRHLTESIQLDCELGFVGFDELIEIYQDIAKNMLSYAYKNNQDYFKTHKIKEPKIKAKVPILKLKEAQEIIFKEFGRNVRGENDLGPDDERDICQWAAKKYNSDLITITHFPIKKRAFYTAPDPKNPELSLSYDLLFAGAEILSGSLRIHKLSDLQKAMRDKDISPDNFSMYLQAFSFGMPPHGGFSFGLERLTWKLLQLANVRQASLFPRDLERIDIHLPTKYHK